jgi:cell division protein FtsL
MSADEITQAVAHHLDKRYKRIVRLVLVMLAGLAIGAAVLAYTVLRARDAANRAKDAVEQVQASRVESARLSCETTNQEHRALIAFVGQADRRLAAQAVAAFPIEADCTAFARGRVNVR